MWSFNEKRQIKIYFEKYIKACRTPGKRLRKIFVGQRAFVPEQIVVEH